MLPVNFDLLCIMTQMFCELLLTGSCRRVSQFILQCSAEFNEIIVFHSKFIMYLDVIMILSKSSFTVKICTSSTQKSKSKYHINKYILGHV